MYRKYKNKKVEIDGILFDSKKEAIRYTQLKLLEKAKEIEDLKLQTKYVLIPAQYIEGKCVERGINYIADFEYKDKRTGKIVVEDVKGIRTKEYIIKRKMMLYFHKIQIKEIDKV